MIELSLNNTPTKIAEHTTLEQAITEWGFTEGKFAVAINGEFVARSCYNERQLLAGDEVDIVKPVGGG